MTELGKLTVPIEADAGKFVTEVKAATKWLGNLQVSSERVASANDSFSKALKGTATELNSLWSIAQRVTGAFKSLYDAAADGARNQVAGEFFRNAGKSIDEYRAATKGLISDAKLMKKANLADSMGISEEAFKRLSMVANAASLKTGQSFEHMFDSIIVGTARSSRLLLDNLGIIVSVGKANEAYAKSINKTVEELTAEEKQLAFVNEVMKASQGQVAELEAISNTLASTYDQLEASAENAGNALKDSLAKGMSGVARALTDFLQQWNSLPEGARNFMMASTGVGGLAVGAGAAAIGVPGWLAALGGGVAATGIAGVTGNLALREQERRREMETLVLRKNLGPLEGTWVDFASEAGGQSTTSRERVGGLPDEIKDMILAPFKEGTTLRQAISSLSKEEIQLFDDKLTYLSMEDRAYQDIAKNFTTYVNNLQAFEKQATELGGLPGQRIGLTAGDMFDPAKVDEEAAKAAKKLAETWEKGLSGWSTVTEQTWWEHERQLEEAAQKAADAETDARIEAFNRVAEQMQKEAANRKKINETILALQEQEYAKGKQLTTDPQGFLRDQIENLFKPREGDMISIFREGLLNVMAGIDMGKGINLQGGLKPFFDSFDSLGITSAAVDGALGGLADAALGAATGGISMLLSAISSIATAAIDLVMQIVQANPFVNRAQEGMGLVFEQASRQLDPFMRGVEQIVGVLLYFFDVVGTEMDGFTLLKDIVGGVVNAFIELHAGLLDMRAAFLAFYIQLDDMGIDIMSDEDKEQNRNRVTRYQARADEMRRMDGPDFSDYLEGRLEENADAVAENTKAVRDLAREFKNLPSGYKIAGADFATSRGTPRPVVGGVLSGDAASWADQRAGDTFRWRR